MDQKSSSTARGPLALLAIAVALIASACGVTINRGSGEAFVEQLDLDLSGVSVVDAEEIWSVQVEQGEIAGVEIRIDDNLRDRIDVVVDGDTLSLGLRNGITSPEIGFNAVVTLPSVAQVKASDSAELTATDLVTEELAVSASDSAAITLSGSSTTANVDASDASEVDLVGLQLTDVQVKASDAASIDLTATGVVNGEASDAADVTVSGGASVKVSTSDAASISSN